MPEAEQKGVKQTMQRILALLMICLFMVAVMAITASTAFADPNFIANGTPPGQTGNPHPGDKPPR
jgi:hypothetical protein